MVGWSLRIWSDVEFEDIGRQIESRAGVGYIYDSTDPSLNWRSAENRVSLFAREPEFFHVLDRVETRASVSDMWIEVILLPLFIDGDSFEDDMVGVVRLQRTWHENGVCDAVHSHPIFDYSDA